MRRILLIEPDIPLGKTYTKALKNADYIVDWVTSAQQAIDSADVNKPDLVVLELQMAMHNGLEFLYEFRSYAEWQDIPVIINSFVPRSEFPEESLLEKQLGVVVYYYKPTTSLKKLISSINEQIFVSL